MDIISLNLVFIAFTLITAILLYRKHLQLKGPENVDLGFRETSLGLFLIVTVQIAGALRISFGSDQIDPVIYAAFVLAFAPGTYLFVKGVSKLINLYQKLASEIEDRKSVEKKLKALSVEYEKSAHEAEQANKSKTEFLTKMSHELRTPLNAVIGFSSMMTEAVFGEVRNRKYEEYAGLIHASGEHLLQIINDILDLSKIEAGRVELNEEVFCLSELAQDCFKYVEAEATEKEISLQIDAPSNICIYADKRISRQMTLNLLSNAIKFTARGGAIKLQVTRADQVSLIVEDTGVGMSPEELKIALEPFGQVESVMTRTNQGTGLGLVLVRSFIELHGGKMYIATEKGEGTSVCLQYPHKRVTEDDPSMDTI